MAWYDEYRNTPYEPLLTEYTSQLEKMPKTEAGGYLGIKAPVVPYPTMPTYSLGRERMLQQQYGAPAMTKLSQGALSALTQARNRPFPAQSYLTREALSGYGEGLGSIMASAISPAQKAQMAELGLEQQGLMGKYGADYQTAMNQYNVDYQTALMKERERQSLIDRINDFKLKQALLKYQGTLSTGSSPRATPPSLGKSGMTPTPLSQYPTQLYTPPTSTSTSTAIQDWIKKYSGGGYSGGQGLGDYNNYGEPSDNWRLVPEDTSSPSSSYEPTQAELKTMLDKIIPETKYPYGGLLSPKPYAPSPYGYTFGGG